MVEISPCDEPGVDRSIPYVLAVDHTRGRPGSYPIYLREHLKQGGPAPMKKITRYVAEKELLCW